MKQQIINLLQISDKPLSIKQLKIQLKITPKQQKKLLELLTELKTKKILKANKLQKIFLSDSYKQILQGVIQVTRKGMGFIKLENSNYEYRVKFENLNNALDGDLVFYKPHPKKIDEAIVVDIIKRKMKKIIGIIYFDKIKKIKTLKVQNYKLQRYNVLLINKNKANVNDIVICKIKSFTKNTFTLLVEKIIGITNDKSADSLMAIHEMGIKIDYEKKTLAASKNINQVVSEAEKKERVDLRNEILVTIDGCDAQDFDDAICVYKLANGNYRLFVAIADVSHYVTPKSPLDTEAFKRGTSVYLADCVIAMLPPLLSNGICSLKEAVERLCFVCDLEIDLEGNILNKKLYKGLMKSWKRMTYDEVNLAFQGKKVAFMSTHPQIWSMLQHAKELYEILAKNKNKKGAIDFEIKEPKIVINNDGKVEHIIVKTRDVAEKLIETFMITANEVVAKMIFNLKLPFIYRVHEPPQKKKIQQILAIAKLMNISLKKIDDEFSANNLQFWLESNKNLPHFQILAFLLLRTMKKARYSINNTGHFGLVSDCYTHFTSPIRRYPDLLVHRLLNEYLFNSSPKSQDSGRLKFISLAAEHATNMEIKAMECERIVEQLKKIEYMTRYIGEKFTGIISGITGFGIFVELQNTVEGLIKLSELDDDYYHYDETTLTLTGQKTNKKYHLGQEIVVVVKDVNKTTRTIDFSLEKAKIVSKAKSYCKNFKIR